MLFFSLNLIHLLEKLYVFDDLRLNIFVESSGQCPVLHHEVLAKGRGKNLNVERLVLHEEFARIFVYAFTHHFRPCFYDSKLIVGSFESFLSHELTDDAAYLFCILPSHIANLLR